MAYSGKPGVSTLGTKLYYYIAKANDSALPTLSGDAKYTCLHRINSIAEITLDTETIDASALEDEIEQAVAGRASMNGGGWNVTVNATSETIAEWQALINAYNTALATDAETTVYFVTSVKGLSGKMFAVEAEPPAKIPYPSFDQNGLLTVAMSCTVNTYLGIVDAVASAKLGD